MSYDLPDLISALDIWVKKLDEVYDSMNYELEEFLDAMYDKDAMAEADTAFSKIFHARCLLSVVKQKAETRLEEKIKRKKEEQEQE